MIQLGPYLPVHHVVAAVGLVRLPRAAVDALLPSHGVRYRVVAQFGIAVRRVRLRERREARRYERRQPSGAGQRQQAIVKAYGVHDAIEHEHVRRKTAIRSHGHQIARVDPHVPDRRAAERCADPIKAGAVVCSEHGNVEPQLATLESLFATALAGLEEPVARTVDDDVHRAVVCRLGREESRCDLAAG